MVRVVACLPVLTLVLAAAPLAADDPKPADEAKQETGFRMTDDEKQLVEMTNAERAKKKLPPLKPNATLFKVARLHSANMAKQGQMTHVLDGKNPAQRTEAGGYDWGKVAENVAQVENLPKDKKPPLEDIMQGWMDSKVHRDNILKAGLEEIGIGIARNDKGEVYFTQLFGTQRRRR